LGLSDDGRQRDQVTRGVFRLVLFVDILEIGFLFSNFRTMKLNFANPANGAQKTIDIEDENILYVFALLVLPTLCCGACFPRPVNVCDCH